MKITFTDILSRFVKYLDSNVLLPSLEKQEVIVIVMDVIILHLQRLEKRGLEVSEEDKVLYMRGGVDEMDESDIMKESEQEYKDAQQNLDSIGLTRVVVKAISHCKNEVVRTKALELVHNMMKNGNSTVQLSINKILTTEETDGAFFFKIRELIRQGGEDLKEYRNVRKLSEARSESLVEGCLSVILVFEMMSQLCEGHQSITQNLLREQSSNARSANLIGESMNYFCVLAKSLACVRKWNDVEAQCGLGVLQFLTEAVQGPCSVNQEVILTRAKCIDSCLSILSAKLKNVQDVGLASDLVCSVSVLLSACLESRESPDLAKSLFNQVPIAIIADRLKLVANKMQVLKKKVSERSARGGWVVASELLY